MTSAGGGNSDLGPPVRQLGYPDTTGSSRRLATRPDPVGTVRPPPGPPDWSALEQHIGFRGPPRPAPDSEIPRAPTRKRSERGDLEPVRRAERQHLGSGRRGRRYGHGRPEGTTAHSSAYSSCHRQPPAEGSDPSATASARPTQDTPSNTNIAVRVDSPGNIGGVGQQNEAQPGRPRPVLTPRPVQAAEAQQMQATPDLTRERQRRRACRQPRR